MKTIGLIGGMSWESTVIYYQLLNRMAREKLGGLHSAQLLLWSFDFDEIEKLQASDDWDAATEQMVAAAGRLESGGAECIVICTNTMHRMAAEVAAAVAIPLLHIADATGTAIREAGVKRPLLLGTRFTMEHDFYKGHLEREHGIKAVIPNADQRKIVHDVIYDELCLGDIRESSRHAYERIVAEHVAAGADGVIFGCTEVGLLLNDAELAVPAFDTTELHARAALAFALET